MRCVGSLDISPISLIAVESEVIGPVMSGSWVLRLPILDAISLTYSGNLSVRFSRRVFWAATKLGSVSFINETLLLTSGKF
jgi:hypothetical protein